MVAWYKRIGAGEPRGAALRAVQLEMLSGSRGGGKWRHPALGRSGVRYILFPLCVFRGIPAPMRFPRLGFAGARHHVMNRDARREPIFLDDESRALFLDVTAPVGRHGNPANWLAAWWLSRGCGIPHARIANAFGANCGTVSKRIAWVEARLGQDEQLTEWATALRRSKGERGCT